MVHRLQHPFSQLRLVSVDAKMYQFQVFYRDKIRQFYVDKVIHSYSDIVGEIVTNISSLFGCVFQIQYMNDEQMWVTLSEVDKDVQDLFRCSTVVPTADYRRIKVKIIEGTSPHPTDNSSCKRGSCDVYDFDGSVTAKKTRVKLFTDCTADDYCTTENVYKTPIELDIEDKEKSISDMDTYLQTLEIQRSELGTKYMFSSSISKVGKQCSRCHLYQSHRKNNCPNDACVSAMMCGDTSKHPDETAEIRELENKIQKIRSDLKKEKIDLENKKKCKEKILGSFEKQIELELINSDRKRYLIQTPFGVKPKQALINEHVSILERHYHGKIPRELSKERHAFRRIIDSSLNKFSSSGRSSKGILASNPVYTVSYPGTRSAVATPPPPTDQPPLPVDLPPPPPPPPVGGLPASYMTYGWMPGPWYQAPVSDSNLTCEDAVMDKDVQQ